MINFINISKEEPYNKFQHFYSVAQKNNQKNIEAIAISSYNPLKKEVNSRYVNLKYIDINRWIFFTNYLSPKANEFNLHKQISCIFYWNVIDVQIRLKGDVFKLSDSYSDKHFYKRKIEKNALAIVSNQSKKIDAYNDIVEKYQKYLGSSQELDNVRPDYWGGFQFIPTYFEFWEGNENRLNKRKVYVNENNTWSSYFLQP